MKWKSPALCRAFAMDIGSGEMRGSGDLFNLLVDGRMHLVYDRKIKREQPAEERARLACETCILRFVREERDWGYGAWHGTGSSSQVDARFGGACPRDGRHRRPGPNGGRWNFRQHTHGCPPTANFPYLQGGYVQFDAGSRRFVASSLRKDRSFSQLVSRVSGRTRVSAVTVIKLVSPIQRGRACM